MPATTITTTGIAANTEAQVAGPNIRRRRIMFTFSGAQACYIRNDSQGNAAGPASIIITLSSGPLELTAEDHGDIVTKPWFALSGVLGNVSVLETID